MHAQSSALQALGIKAESVLNSTSTPHNPHQERHLQLQAVLRLRARMSGCLPLQRNHVNA